MSSLTSTANGTISLSPVTRIEGHLDIELVVEDGVVTEAFSAGTMFRGFEKILRGRDPLDATHYTQRICGVCPIAHGMASSKTLEAALGIPPLDNGRILRNLILGANFLQSHILHFYHLALLDYVDTSSNPTLNKSPWQPTVAAGDMLSGDVAAGLLKNYVLALEMRRRSHQLGAIFGGKLPCSPVFVPSGCTETVTQEKIDAFSDLLLLELIPFITTEYRGDVACLADHFAEYLDIGGGCGNLLSFGVFDTDAGSYLPAGTYSAPQATDQTGGIAAVQAVDFNPGLIEEDLTHSYYDDTSGEPIVGKEGAYSWIKAPRYAGQVYEVGPLARMKVAGRYTGGISVMDRLLARQLETEVVAEAMANWLGQGKGKDQLSVGEPGHFWAESISSCEGRGLTEAPRGALGHWIEIGEDAKISGYQIITPTAWNASPRVVVPGDGVVHEDELQRGPIEQALVGTRIAADVDNPNELPRVPIEALRVVHSFDPCLACSVHLARPRGLVRGHRVEP
jgi:hydrogenase large subunit